MARTRGAFPTWLEWSGLPSHLTDEIQVGAWSVFKKVVELDCERNRTPDAVEVTVEELAARSGVPADKARRILERLRKKRVLLAFLPETDEEPALLQVKVPLKTPLSLDEVATARPELDLLSPSGDARYAVDEDEVDPDDPAIQRVIDLYFRHLGLRMNSFVLDELIFIARRHPRRDIERVFAQASNHARPSLRWAVQELSRRRARRQSPARR